MKVSEVCHFCVCYVNTISFLKQSSSFFSHQWRFYLLDICSHKDRSRTDGTERIKVFKHVKTCLNFWWYRMKDTFLFCFSASSGHINKVSNHATEQSSAKQVSEQQPDVKQLKDQFFHWRVHYEDFRLIWFLDERVITQRWFCFGLVC